MGTYIIVHGAFGGGWQWNKVASLLRARGHKVLTPSLTGHGERVHLATPEVGLDTHIQDIVNVLDYEDLQQVVLAGHSYGGMAVTGVADRVPERLSHLIYLNALIPKDGQSAFDLLPAAMRQSFEESAVSNGDGWRIPPPPFEDDSRVAAFTRGRLVASPIRMFRDAIQLGPPHAGLQRTFIWCTEDPQGLTGVADLMQPFAEHARNDPGWRFRQVKAPANALILDPQAVFNLFNEAAPSN